MSDEPQVGTGLLNRGQQVDPVDIEQRRGVLMERLFGELRAPIRLGRFEILDTAGEGAMGRVYLARDPKLDRRIAIKRILSEHLEGPQLERRRNRLLREARAVAQLSHPNVVEVYDVGVVDEDVYVAMEFVDGHTLRAAHDRLGDDWRGLLRLYLQAGEGLAAAHEAGIVHRDFKPDNALVGRDQRVRVVDFGLAIPAQRTDSDEAPPTEDVEPATLDGISYSHAVGGTPAYMPPEQVAGEEVGPASDQFAFCVSLYEALYGVRPFEEPNQRRRLARILEEDFRSPERGAQLPAQLRAAIVVGLRPSPEQRYATMRELLAALGDAAKRDGLRWPCSWAGDSLRPPSRPCCGPRAPRNATARARASIRRGRPPGARRSETPSMRRRCAMPPTPAIACSRASTRIATAGSSSTATPASPHTSGASKHRRSSTSACAASRPGARSSARSPSCWEAPTTR